MRQFTIETPDSGIKEKILHKINNKTKPPGSLGILEDIALQIGWIQQSTSPQLNHPTILVFSGDHGITEEGVSPFPQEVTSQMVLNFVKEGAAINVFARQNSIKVKVIDAGVKGTFDPPIQKQIINAKIAKGTKNFFHGPAMTKEQCQEAIRRGAEITENTIREGCNIIGFGEMGIGNTSSSAMIMHLVTGQPLKVCAGKGTGLDHEGINRKKAILEKSLKHYRNNRSPLDILSHFGGFELAMIVGGILQAAHKKITLLIDGFNVTAALLLARKIEPNVQDYCIFTHQSNEKGHQTMLKYIDAQPLLQLNMRLGEGSGAAVAYPIVKSSVNFLNEMASFDDAGVSNRS